MKRFEVENIGILIKTGFLDLFNKITYYGENPGKCVFFAGDSDFQGQDGSHSPVSEVYQEEQRFKEERWKSLLPDFNLFLSND